MVATVQVYDPRGELTFKLTTQPPPPPFPSQREVFSVAQQSLSRIQASVPTRTTFGALFTGTTASQPSNTGPSSPFNFGPLPPTGSGSTPGSTAPPQSTGLFGGTVYTSTTFNPAFTPLKSSVPPNTTGLFGGTATSSSK